jgi:hypothetical protein
MMILKMMPKMMNRHLKPVVMRKKTVLLIHRKLQKKGLKNPLRKKLLQKTSKMIILKLRPITK